VVLLPKMSDIFLIFAVERTAARFAPIKIILQAALVLQKHLKNDRNINFFPRDYTPCDQLSYRYVLSPPNFTTWPAFRLDALGITTLS